MHILKRCMHSQDGFSTAGTAIALLLVCALTFSSLQVYEIQQESHKVQVVADTAAQAAGVEVAAYITAVRVADAALLSMSLATVTMIGIGIVCSCVPTAQGLGTACIDAGRDIMRLEKTVAEKAVDLLNGMQQGLTLLAAGQAFGVANENAHEGATYVAFTELIPSEVMPIKSPLDAEAIEHIENVADSAEDIQQTSTLAEEACTRAQEALHEGYLYDCGNAPGYCMYERAASLSTISPADNPMIHTEQTWSFQDAIERARAYYESRASEEVPGPGDLHDKVKSVLRARFYDYAVEVLDEAYVRSDEGRVVAVYMPQLPATKEALKKTTLYTDRVYPVSTGIEDAPLLHAWSGCPYCEEPLGKGSLEELDQGLYDVCPGCEFTTSEMARVAAASSVIDNGFEYHYKKVAEAAEAYTACMNEAQPYIKEVQGQVEQGLEKLGLSLELLQSCRITVCPPGNSGVICAVTAHHAATDQIPFLSKLPSWEGGAISSVAIVDDEDETVIDSVAQDIGNKIGIDGIASGLDMVGGVWSWALSVYSNGIEGAMEGFDRICSELPLVSHSGLGQWACGALRSCMQGLGITPTNIAKPKIAVVNTEHLLAYGEGPLCEGIRRMKELAAVG